MLNQVVIPNFVGQAQTAAPFIAAAIVVVVALLIYENWPEKPKRRF